MNAAWAFFLRTIGHDSAGELSEQEVFFYRAAVELAAMSRPATGEPALLFQRREFLGDGILQVALVDYMFTRLGTGKGGMAVAEGKLLANAALARRWRWRGARAEQQVPASPCRAVVPDFTEDFFPADLVEYEEREWRTEGSSAPLEVTMKTAADHFEAFVCDQFFGIRGDLRRLWDGVIGDYFAISADQVDALQRASGMRGASQNGPEDRARTCTGDEACGSGGDVVRRGHDVEMVPTKNKEIRGGGRRFCDALFPAQEN